MIAVAGVTHKDLLLETPVTLPVLQVNIQLAQFFQFAPVVLVLLHLGLISQLTLLARETLEFDHSIRLLEATDKRTHPLRLELNNFFFVQAIAGPYRSKVMSVFLHGMSWLTLVVLPVVLILYIQVVFLPYHDVKITWTHRVALLVDIAMLISIGIFLMRAEVSFVHAFMRTTSAHPVSFLVTILVLLFVTLLSFSVATIPGESLDRFTQSVLGIENEDETGQGQRFAKGFAVPFLSFGSEGSLLGIFQRNLHVVDTDLVADKDQTPGEPSISLRGRDLRFAKLDRSDLHQADFTGADLRGASLAGTDLRGAWLQCADLTELLLSEDRVAANCPTARRANFTRARLEEAHMIGIDLRSAKLEEAKLEGAELGYSLLGGANFSSAHLEKADLTGGVQAQGASFLIASLQGADFTGAQLQAADFSSANLEGASLNYAHLEAAVLRDADLSAASLNRARLEGADLTGAKVTGADFRGASIWMTRPPAPDPAGLADFSELYINPITETDVAAMKQAIERIKSRRARTQISEKLMPLMDVAEAAKWVASPDLPPWQSLAAASVATPPETYKFQLTEYLAKLQCKARWGNGSVATGIARRAQTPQFRGDVVVLYDRLNAGDCPTSKLVAAKVLRDFGAAADALRGS
jgi:uncharacterized protein YjbI with pentapeptide repeats